MRLRSLGFIFLFVGIAIIITSAPSITGFVISENTSFSNFIRIFGIAFFVGGLILIVSEKKDLESQVEVYDDGLGKNLKDRERSHYFLIDSTGAVSSEGRVNLDEFSRQIEKYKKEKDGVEYIGLIREVYGSKLQEIVSQGGDKGKIAQAFLDVLDGPRKESSDLSISQEEKREISNAFRGWDGTPNRAQKEILIKYGMTYEHGTNHGKIRLGSRFATVSSTPSAEAGGPITTDLANLIRDYREDERKKKKAS